MALSLGSFDRWNLVGVTNTGQGILGFIFVRSESQQIFVGFGCTDGEQPAVAADVHCFDLGSGHQKGFVALSLGLLDSLRGLTSAELRIHKL